MSSNAPHLSVRCLSSPPQPRQLQIVGAPPPSGAVISRGLAGEGWGLIICGLIGSSNGTTSYSENVGALALTKVGSRAVVQTGALFMMFVGLFPKYARSGLPDQGNQEPSIEVVPDQGTFSKGLAGPQ